MAFSGNIPPQNWILSFSALDRPVWSKHIPACSKNRIFETKIPACFYISLFQMASTMPGAPSSMRCPSQCDRDGLVQCAYGLQPHEELQKQLGCPAVCWPTSSPEPREAFSALRVLTKCFSPAWTPRQPWGCLAGRGEMSTPSCQPPGGSESERPPVTLPSSPLQLGCAHPPWRWAVRTPRAKMCAIWLQWEKGCCQLLLQTALSF